MIGRAALAALLLVAGAIPAAAQVYVVRHFDTSEGARDPDLLPQGQRRAEALARWFLGKRLTAIYISDFKRTHQTAAPLAAARSLPPILYDPRDTPALVATLKATRGPILIVGHSNTVPDIVAGLGGARPAPLAHEDFGDIWTIRRGRTTRSTIAP